MAINKQKPVMIVQDEIYGTVLSVHICSQDDYLLYLERHIIVNKIMQERKGGFTVLLKDKKSGLLWYSIWMREPFDIDNTECQAVLQHETNHVAMFVIFGAMIQITKENQEPFNYLATYFYRKIASKLKEEKDKKFNKIVKETMDEIKNKVKDFDHATLTDMNGVVINNIVGAVCDNCKHFYMNYTYSKCAYNVTEFFEKDRVDKICPMWANKQGN